MIAMSCKVPPTMPLSQVTGRKISTDLRSAEIFFFWCGNVLLCFSRFPLIRRNMPPNPLRSPLVWQKLSQKLISIERFTKLH